MGRRSQPVGWTSHALGQPGGPCSSGGQSAAAEQLEQVVASADQGPLGVDLLQTPQQELPEAPARLDLAEDRLHRLHPQSVTLTTPFGLQLPPHPVPGGEMTGYATSGRWRNHSAVAGLLRCDVGVHAQGLEVVDCLCRVIASIGGYFPGTAPTLSMVSCIIAAACCLSEDWLVARAATITWWAWSTTA